MEANKKSNIWIYAVILFTSAFLILLFTAYSQIKLNKSLDNYKNQIRSKETEKNEYLQNFTSAQEMNLKLNEEISSLKEEIEKLNDEISLLKNELENKEIMQNKKDNVMEIILKATAEYVNGNVVGCASILREIDEFELSGVALESFNQLKIKSYSEAGKVLFNEGYSLFNKGKYEEASEKLLLSSEYAPSETFSDKCIYYLAYSELKKGNETTAVGYMEKLISGYPSSKYLKSAKNFVSRYKK